MCNATESLVSKIEAEAIFSMSSRREVLPHIFSGDEVLHCAIIFSARVESSGEPQMRIL